LHEVGAGGATGDNTAAAADYYLAAAGLIPDAITQHPEKLLA
jgi:hypothetical protein